MISHGKETYRILDAHTHFAGDPTQFDRTIAAMFEKLRSHQRFNQLRVGRDPAELLVYLDRAGIDVLTVLAEEGPPTNYSVDSSFILGYAAQAPDRIIPIGNVNHRIETNVARRVRHLIRAGIRGFKQYFADHNQNPYDERLTPLFELCAECRLPILIHCGTHSRYYMTNHAYGEPILFEKLFATYPSIPFVMCHGGKGGRHEECLRLLHTYANTFIEISDIPQTSLEVMCSEELASRFIFGTDMPQFPDYAPLLKAVLDLKLSVIAKKKIFFDNAAELFHVQTVHSTVSSAEAA
jgi:predicted TIM-barrel fold metal-dependent hydrolase